MKNIKLGYTLAEVIVAITILIIITGLTIPVVKKILPDSDKDKMKHVYYQLSSVIASMTTDPYLYPTGRFDNPRKYKNEQTQIEFEKGEKFTKAFASRLNVLKIKDLNYDQEWNPEIKINDALKQNVWNQTLGYDDVAITVPRALVDDNNIRTCILTNGKVYYCLAKETFRGDTDSSETSDRFYTQPTSVKDGRKMGNVIIKVYLSDDHSMEKGYYFTVNNVGKISLLPTDDITCIGHNPCKTEEDDYTCADDKVYDTFNQCRIYEYLAETK